MQSAAANRRGAGLMMAAMGCYVLNDAFIKLTTDRLPPGQILAVRGAFAWGVVLALSFAARKDDGSTGWRQTLRPIVVLRCALEVTTALASVIALSLLPLAVVTALMMSAPLMIVVATMLFGLESRRPARLAATAIGFAGVLVVVRPFAETSVSIWGIGCALLCAASLAARDIVTRCIPSNISSAQIAVLTTATVCIAGVAFGAAETWPALERGETLALGGAALCAALGNYALIAACRGVELAAVTPFRYSIIVWAVLLGYLVWGEVPDLLTVVGIGLIAAGGLCAVYAVNKS